ncbi:SET and MYND domain-containing protein 4-like [Homarus americanus]|uniref:SET and MYND domain-containing protein 4-like n=1 Tax=Homarus americanus TaxID=6706 RepID=UPI001C4516C4|nr:SET and MYND domain-containing protein 4-like [Homarus americanus]
MERPGQGTSEQEVEYLKKVCSDVTLYSLKEGFFKHYMEQIDAQVSQDYLHKFGQLKNNEARIIKTWAVKPIHTLKVQSFYKHKSREVSESRRTDGNKAYQEKKYQQALLNYSQAVMRAPYDEGESLALALANRSAVLYHMKEYQLALHDIQLALQVNYPINLIYKVLDRRGQCYLCLGKFTLALNAFTEAAEALATSSLDHKKQELWKNDLRMKIHTCEEKVDGDEPVPASNNEVTLFCGQSDPAQCPLLRYLYTRRRIIPNSIDPVM